jgi:hypothetical protein
VTCDRRVPQFGHSREPWPLWPLVARAPFGCQAYLSMPPRALDELMRAQSTAALEMMGRAYLSEPAR